MNIKILETEYPIRYTVHAENLISRKVGGIENLEAEMEKGGTAGAVDVLAYMIAALIEGGVQRARVEAQLMGNEYHGPQAIGYEEIIQLMDPGEIVDMRDIIMDAIKEGNKTNIQLKPSKKKAAQ